MTLAFGDWTCSIFTASLLFFPPHEALPFLQRISRGPRKELGQKEFLYQAMISGLQAEGAKKYEEILVESFILFILYSIP